MKAFECPKFDPPNGHGCSAAICPLHGPIVSQAMINGERICYYLTEHAKINSEANFRLLALGELYKLLSQCVEDIKNHPRTSPYLKRAYELASKSSSKMAKGIKLRETKHA
jgi:hypothetical protein